MPLFTKQLFRAASHLLVSLYLFLAPSHPAIAAEEDASYVVARMAPDWLKNSLVYEVFPRNFTASGDFNGITARLDELKDLGVDVLWLMPIHPIGEKLRKGTLGSPYAVRDYRAVNPDYGSLEDFRRLVQEAHSRDMRVIIDIVANHTAWDSVMMAQPEFYRTDDDGNIISPNPGWADVAALNYDNPELRRYMIDMLKFWVRDVGVDGFRCDVAHLVPTDFWEAARVELDGINPDVFMLAESSEPELLVNAFDLDYSWPLHDTLNDVLLRGAPASQFQATWEQQRKRFPKGSVHLRFSDNHDEARAISRFGISGALAAQVLMMTLDGVPLLYNGMEVGDATESGAPALFEKLPIFWEPKQRPPFREIYRDLIQMRRQHPAFTNDRVVWLNNSQPDEVVTFMRSDDADEFVIVINFANRPVTVSVNLKNAGGFRPRKVAGMAPSADFPDCHLKVFEWRVYHRAATD